MKGLFSLDAIVAILLLLFILIWGQSLASSDFDRANSFGVNYEVKAEAIRVGSLMNTFVSTEPGVNDYATLAAPDARAFADDSASLTSSKSLASELTVMLQSRFGSVSSTYPVIARAVISGGKITAQ